eukprot:366211-Chlamydomonas_euryale.AAC.8
MRRDRGRWSAFAAAAAMRTQAAAGQPSAGHSRKNEMPRAWVAGRAPVNAFPPPPSRLPPRRSGSPPGWRGARGRPFLTLRRLSCWSRSGGGGGEGPRAAPRPRGSATEVVCARACWPSGGVVGRVLVVAAVRARACLSKSVSSLGGWGVGAPLPYSAAAGDRSATVARCGGALKGSLVAA